VCGNTVKKALKDDVIQRRKATLKPCISPEHKAARVAICLKYRHLNWRNVIFTDESYFETGDLRRRRARGVLRRPGEAYVARNLGQKFATGVTVMF
jgi:hypothetical protein